MMMKAVYDWSLMNGPGIIKCHRYSGIFLIIILFKGRLFVLLCYTTLPLLPPINSPDSIVHIKGL